MDIERVCTAAQLLIKSMDRTSDIYELAYLCMEQLYGKFCTFDYIDSEDAENALKSLGLIIDNYIRLVDNIRKKQSKLESGSLYGKLALDDLIKDLD